MSLEIRRSTTPNLLLYAMVYRQDYEGMYVLEISGSEPAWDGLAALGSDINALYAIDLDESDERSGYYEADIELPDTEAQTLQVEVWEQMGSAPDRDSDLLHAAYETLWSGAEDESRPEIEQVILDIQAAVNALASQTGTATLSQADRRLLVRLSNQINSVRKSV